MDGYQGKKHMFNVLLAKYIGLDHILNPDSAKLNGYNVYHVVSVFLIIYVILVSIITCINGLYYWKAHRNEAILYFGIAETCLFSSYKMSTIIYRSKDISECLSISRFDFTSHSRHRDKSLLEQWRSRIIRITNMYAIVFILSTTLFVLSPMVIGPGESTNKTLNRSLSDYRPNVINLYAMLSAETYNKYFNAIYLVELSCICLFVFFVIIFDTLLITLCLALSSQLQMIKVALELSGPKRAIEDSVQSKITRFSYIIYSFNIVMDYV